MWCGQVEARGCVGHIDHVLIVYSSMEHVTTDHWKSSGPICVADMTMPDHAVEENHVI